MNNEWKQFDHRSNKQNAVETNLLEKNSMSKRSANKFRLWQKRISSTIRQWAIDENDVLQFSSTNRSTFVSIREFSPRPSVENSKEKSRIDSNRTRFDRHANWKVRRVSIGNDHWEHRSVCRVFSIRSIDWKKCHDRPSSFFFRVKSGFTSVNSMKLFEVVQIDFLHRSFHFPIENLRAKNDDWCWSSRFISSISRGAFSRFIYLEKKIKSFINVSSQHFLSLDWTKSIAPFLIDKVSSSSVPFLSHWIE